MKQQFKDKDVAARRGWFSLFSSAMTVLLALGAMVFPGGQGGAVHAAEKEKTFCELNPYDVTCAGGTCDIYTQYCPPWSGGAVGGGTEGNKLWNIPRNAGNSYSYVACTGSSYAERKAYAVLAVQAHLPVMNYYGGLSNIDVLAITFADGLVRTYTYNENNDIDPFDGGYPGAEQYERPCESGEGLPPQLRIP